MLGHIKYSVNLIKSQFIIILTTSIASSTNRRLHSPILQTAYGTGKGVGRVDMS
jgi:hypothetical protein